MNSLIETAAFSDWLIGLSDRVAKRRILMRLEKARLGHWGEVKPVGEGVTEMKIDVGPGYRVYYTRNGDVVYVLLCGGDKSTQKKDIQRAQAMAQMLSRHRS